MSRGRILQGPVQAERGAIPVMPTLRRWGSFKRFEAKLEAIYGRDVADCVLFSSLGHKGFTPIAGFPAYVHDGMLVPRVSGGAGFSGFADVRAEMLGGKQQVFRVDKAGTAGGGSFSVRQLFGKPGIPAQGGNGPGITDNTTVGGLQQRNAASGDTLHFAAAEPFHSVAGAVVMFDYIYGFGVDAAIATVQTTGAVPTRWQGATDSKWNWIGSKVTVALGATVTNHTITYVNDAGTGGRTAVVSNPASRTVHSPLGSDPSGWQWWPATPDYGVRSLTDVTCAAANTAGTYDIMIGHNYVCMPCPMGDPGMSTAIDGWMSAFNFVQIIDNSCLAFMEFSKTGSTGGNCTIENLMLVSG